MPCTAQSTGAKGRGEDPHRPLRRMNGAPRSAGPGLPFASTLSCRGRTAAGLGTTLRWRAWHRPDGMQVDATALCRAMEGLCRPFHARGKPSGANVPVRPTTGRSLATRLCLGTGSGSAYGWPNGNNHGDSCGTTGQLSTEKGDRFSLSPFRVQCARGATHRLVRGPMH